MKFNIFLMVVLSSVLLTGCGQKVLSMNSTGYANQYEIIVEGDTGYAPIGKIYLEAEKQARRKCKNISKNYHKVSDDIIYAAPMVWPRVTLVFECNNNLIPTEQKILIIDSNKLSTKIEELNKLYKSGLITKEEYDKKRNELLDNF